MKLTFSLCIVFLLTAAFSPALFGQSDSKNDANTSKENPDIAAAKRSLSDFGELLKASNWEEIKNQISKTGQNALVKEVCYSLAIGIEIDRAGAGEDQLPPGLNKIIKSIEKVKDKYELDEVAKLMFEGETQKAMAQLDTSGKKWEIGRSI